MALTTLPGPIVSVEWLRRHLENPRLVLLRATLSEPVVPGVRVFDLDKICDQSTHLPHMMPRAELFEESARDMGIHSDSLIVVYDAKGIYSSPRVRWMFKAMGHDQVAVLDGGFPEWIKQGHPTELLNTNSVTTRGTFSARSQSGFFCDANFVSRALSSKFHRVIDARSEGRFYGREPEPRPGLEPGHMPGAINIPFQSVLNENRMRPVHELKALFSNRVNLDQELIFSCGSGVTACVTALAAELAGYTNICIYDASWSEWGANGAKVDARPPVK